MKITVFLSALISSLFVTVLFPSFLPAQEATSAQSSNSPRLKVIEVEYRTLGGLQYSIDGRSLSRYQDFEELVFPLRDFESERLLRRSESSNFNSEILGATGFAGLVTGVVGLLTSPSNQQTPFWVTAISGAVVFDIGGLFQSEAQTAKFNCVQRYNRFARGEEQVLPRGPEDEKGLLDFGSKEHPGKPKSSK